MNAPFEHVLVPYNGTSGSEKAFGKALSLAISISAKITILTCLEERHALGFFKTRTNKQEFEKERKLVEIQHQKLEELARAKDISCDSKIVKNGLASIAILEFADKHNVGLIVMTRTKPASHYEKQHYHSTVENVFRNAPCPILVL